MPDVYREMKQRTLVIPGARIVREYCNPGDKVCCVFVSLSGSVGDSIISGSESAADDVLALCGPDNITIPGTVTATVGGLGSPCLDYQPFPLFTNGSYTLSRYDGPSGAELVSFYRYGALSLQDIYDFFGLGPAPNAQSGYRYVQTDHYSETCVLNNQVVHTNYTAIRFLRIVIELHACVNDYPDGYKYAIMYGNELWIQFCETDHPEIVVCFSNAPQLIEPEGYAIGPIGVCNGPFPTACGVEGDGSGSDGYTDNTVNWQMTQYAGLECCGTPTVTLNFPYPPPP